jgi:hypothetical protein
LDDPYWYQASITTTEQMAHNLIEESPIMTDQAVVLFIPFPCATKHIIPNEVVDAYAAKQPKQCSSCRGMTSFSITEKGRPATWSCKKYLIINASIKECLSQKKKITQKHFLH